MAKLVLAAQPPPLGTVSLRHVGADYQESKMELVSATPYYQEPNYECIESQEDFVDMSSQPYGITQQKQTL